MSAICGFVCGCVDVWMCGCACASVLGVFYLRHHIWHLLGLCGCHLKAHHLSAQILTCFSAHLRRLYSAAPLVDGATSTITQYQPYSHYHPDPEKEENKNSPWPYPSNANRQTM